MSNIQVVALESQQKERLEGMFKKGRWTARQLKRAEVLLIANDQKTISNTALAQETGCHRETVRKVRRRFLKGGLDAALFDLPRSGQPRKLNDGDKAYVIATACSNPPRGCGYWTLELLTSRLKHHKGKRVSTETVRKVLLENKLKPWRKKNVVNSRNHS